MSVPAHHLDSQTLMGLALEAYIREHPEYGPHEYHDTDTPTIPAYRPPGGTKVAAAALEQFDNICFYNLTIVKPNGVRKSAGKIQKDLELEDVITLGQALEALKSHLGDLAADVIRDMSNRKKDL